MKVTVSLKGRFHAFQLARELQKREALGRLVTSYPRFEVQEHGIDPGLVAELFSPLRPGGQLVLEVPRFDPERLSP